MTTDTPAFAPVRFGVLGASKIGREKVIPAMQASPLCEIVAIASRDETRARAEADALGIPDAYGSYEALIAAGEVEAIYIPLPNHMHVPWTLAAARAGKHVLCEKPIARTAEEAQALLDLPAGVVVSEAYMIRHHPQWQRARALLEEGAIGRPSHVQVSFSFFNRDPANIRNKVEYGGGALLDIGGYAIMAARLLLAADPVRAIALVDRDPDTGVDREVGGLVDLGEDRRLSFAVGTQRAPGQWVRVEGSEGVLVLDAQPFNARADADNRIVVVRDGAERIETIPGADQYRLQGEAFARAVRGETADLTSIPDALVTMRTVDALFRSERSGAFEAVQADFA
ncbi:Gfo/Idh/MocA family protein [Salinarimonas ramus]|uniref:Deoxyfructose oxidoreductase n=1 Tax=Salinarimonas ramus TaxID=690164 RepID=A0A917QAR4_9HYPH|nr:Gfo/Idh/MocA family oxidoreductase [Salinarimonas ramus]GGK39820.1 deoxyfructose oxidoreductase [Salinarimonas ramus]